MSRAKSPQNKIIRSSQYRNSYKEIPIQRKFRKIKFEICQVNYNDCIYVRNDDGEIEKHPRVSWDPTVVSASNQESKQFKEFYDHYKHEILNDWIKNGKLYILWKDSYISPRNIIDEY